MIHPQGPQLGSGFEPESYSLHSSRHVLSTHRMCKTSGRSKWANSAHSPTHHPGLLSVKITFWNIFLQKWVSLNSFHFSLLCDNYIQRDQKAWICLCPLIVRGTPPILAGLWVYLVPKEKQNMASSGAVGAPEPGKTGSLSEQGQVSHSEWHLSEVLVTSQVAQW